MREKEKHLFTIAFQLIKCNKNNENRNLFGKHHSNNHFRQESSKHIKINGQRYDGNSVFI